MSFELLQKVLHGLGQRMAKKEDLSYVLKIDAGDDGIHRLVVEKGDARVEAGDGPATTTLTVAGAQTAVDLFTGKLSPMAAFTDGTIQVGGDRHMLAAVFGGGLGKPKAATSEEIRAAVTVHQAEKCDPSYVLYNSRFFEKANLIDLDGNVIHSWSYPQGMAWHYAEILPNGHLGAIIKETEGADEGMYIELDWESNLVRRIDVAAHHDFDLLENGNVIILCRDYVDNRDVYVPNPMDPAQNAKSDSYLEIDPEGNVVWEWHADEHALELQAFVDVEFPREMRDWAHTNTVEVLRENPLGHVDPRFKPGNIIFSSRHVDTIGVIEKETGRVVWAWGPGTISKQHMPTMLADGHLVIYDNGNDWRRTRVIELDVLANEIVWEYAADPAESFFSPSRGSNQRLANGNTHIADSDSGRLLEVTPEGEIVWEFVNPDTMGGRPQPLYRSMRYSREFIARFKK